MVRLDPVIWNREASGPSTEEELLEFDRNGYLWLSAFVGPDEVAKLKAEVDRLWEERADDCSDEVIRERSSDQIRSIFRVHKTSRVLRGLLSDERLAGWARQILASSIYLHQSRTNYKPVFRGKEFYWHSDFEM